MTPGQDNHEVPWNAVIIIGGTGFILGLLSGLCSWAIVELVRWW